jgi:hypothetical protein
MASASIVAMRRAVWFKGWRTWIIDAAQRERWTSLRDSVAGSVERFITGAPKCRDAEPVGRLRITSWPLNGYEVAMVTHEPAWGGMPAYEVTVALNRRSRCGEP